jgi:hypothetical protein
MVNEQTPWSSRRSTGHMPRLVSTINPLNAAIATWSGPPSRQMSDLGESELMLLIGVPVYGQHEYTHAPISDLRREPADFVIVDNRGDYPRIGDEHVITPGRNLGWARGSNSILRYAFANGYSHAMTLNNDTRLSPVSYTASSIPASQKTLASSARSTTTRAATRGFSPTTAVRPTTTSPNPYFANCRIPMPVAPTWTVPARAGRRLRHLRHRNGLHQPLRQKTADQFSFYAARAQFRYRYGTWRYWLKDWELLTTRTTTMHLPPSRPDAVAAPQLSVVDSGRR